METKETQKNTLPKIIIALPCVDAGGMKAKTAHSIGCMIMTTPLIFTNFLLRMSCDIVSSRTWCVNEAMAKGATHILFVDYDMEFPSDTALKLLIHKKEIVGVEYNKRKLPLEPVFEPMEERKDTLYEAKYTGMGVMLIDLAIFKDPKFGVDEGGQRTPWFNFGRDSQGAMAMGEDAWFSNVARDAGYKTYIDPTIKALHLGEYSY